MTSKIQPCHHSSSSLLCGSLWKTHKCGILVELEWVISGEMEGTCSLVANKLNARSSSVHLLYIYIYYSGKVKLTSSKIKLLWFSWDTFLLWTPWIFLGSCKLGMQTTKRMLWTTNYPSLLTISNLTGLLQLTPLRDFWYRMYLFYLL